MSVEGVKAATGLVVEGANEAIAVQAKWDEGRHKTAVFAERLRTLGGLLTAELHEAADGLRACALGLYDDEAGDMRQGMARLDTNHPNVIAADKDFTQADERALQGWRRVGNLVSSPDIENPVADIQTLLTELAEKAKTLSDACAAAEADSQAAVQGFQSGRNHIVNYGSQL